MKKFEVLLSCMYQRMDDMVCRGNIRCDAVIVNQCDSEGQEQTEVYDSCGVRHEVKFINSAERGLSHSRNTAIRHSTATYCKICDDDEVLDDNIEEKVVDTFSKYPDADVILFNIPGMLVAPFYSEQRIGYRKAMSQQSSRIVFKRESIVRCGITFDEEMGSGTGHGACEEIKFLFDCLHHGMKIYGVPVSISTMQPDSGSQWFKGYTKLYFLQQGWATRRFLGLPLATVYAVYTTIRKYPKYKNEQSPAKALAYLLQGVFCKHMFDK